MSEDKDWYKDIKLMMIQEKEGWLILTFQGPGVDLGNTGIISGGMALMIGGSTDKLPIFSCLSCGYMFVDSYLGP